MWLYGVCRVDRVYRVEAWDLLLLKVLSFVPSGSAPLGMDSRHLVPQTRGTNLYSP